MAIFPVDNRPLTGRNTICVLILLLLYLVILCQIQYMWQNPTFSQFKLLKNVHIHMLPVVISLKDYLFITTKHK